MEILNLHKQSESTENELSVTLDEDQGSNRSNSPLPDRGLMSAMVSLISSKNREEEQGIPDTDQSTQVKIMVDNVQGKYNQ